MKKLKLFISLWFTMFSIVMFGQAEYEKIAITQNTQDNTAGRLLVQDVTTGEVRWILKSILDNKFNQPTGNATQYLDGAGTPTTFPVLGQSDRVITEVRNSTGATITKGTVVYLNGATGGKPNVQKAQANSEATSSGTFGVIQSDINNNSNGYVVVIGTVLGLNTSAYTAGQVLWLSPTTAGGYTTTKPVAPNHAVYVGIVTLAATQGTIEVKIQNGYELDEIHDVLITSKTDNDGLIYESSSGLWKNKQITKAMVGLANVDNTSDLNKPISTATQTALNLKENTANKNTANGYAGLGSDGKLISSQLPAITITDTFVVGSQAAMLALTVETGDVAVRTDVNKSFILKGTNAAILSDWQELLTPTSSVTSVFGRNGAVTANTGDYTADQINETASRKFQTLAQQTYNDATSSIQTQLNSKEPSITAPGTTGSYWRGNKTWATLDTSVIPENGALFFTNDRAKIAVTANSGTINRVSKFNTNGSIANSQIFDNGSSVGIGTDSPNYSAAGRTTVDINGSSQSMLALSTAGVGKGFLFHTGTDLLLSNEINGAIKFNTNGSQKMVVESAGNVGIGTTSPVYKFHVNDTSDGIVGHFSGGVSNYTLISFKSNEASVYSTSLGSYNSGLLFRTGATDRMYINSSGNVGIGTTSPSAKLNVLGDIHIGDYGSSATRNLDFRTSTNLFGITTFPTNSDGTLIQYSWANGGQGPLKFGNASSVVLVLTASGTVLVPTLGTGLVYSNNGTLTSTNPSDRRLKDSIMDLQYGLSDILKLRPVSYLWKNDKINQGKQFGFIAQEVQEVMPELVKEFKTEEGERLGLDKEGIYAALVKAIQEQQVQIKELQKEVELLKNK